MITRILLSMWIRGPAPNLMIKFANPYRILWFYSEMCISVSALLSKWPAASHDKDEHFLKVTKITRIEPHPII